MQKKQTSMKWHTTLHNQDLEPHEWNYYHPSVTAISNCQREVVLMIADLLHFHTSLCNWSRRLLHHWNIWRFAELLIVRSRTSKQQKGSREGARVSTSGQSLIQSYADQQLQNTMPALEGQRPLNNRQWRWRDTIPCIIKHTRNTPLEKPASKIFQFLPCVLYVAAWWVRSLETDVLYDNLLGQHVPLLANGMKSGWDNTYNDMLGQPCVMFYNIRLHVGPSWFTLFAI